MQMAVRAARNTAPGVARHARAGQGVCRATEAAVKELIVADAGWTRCSDGQAQNCQTAYRREAQVQAGVSRAGDAGLPADRRPLDQRPPMTSPA
jgi:hypothetical protein